MEVMYVEKAKTNYFSNKNFIGFFGTLNDLNILIENITALKIKRNYKVSRYLKKCQEYIDYIEIEEELKSKRISELSTAELKLIKLLKTISLNPNVIILNNFDLGFPPKYKSKIKKIIEYANAEHKINFIIITNDIVFLNRIVKHVIISKNKIIKYQGDILTAIKQGYLEKPPILEFIELANKKNAKLEITLNNKELIKNIYRSVF